MGKIFVVKRRAGIEYQIPVKHKCSAFCDGIKCNWNLGWFIETPISYSVYPEAAEKLDALLEVEQI